MSESLIIGVDGEGQDTPDGRHIYTYLCAKDENDKLVADVYSADGLSHEQCAIMLLSLPKQALKFGYMFSYDTTMIIEDMPAYDRYHLVRPDLREAKRCYRCKSRLALEKLVCACGSTEIQKYNRAVTYAGRKYNFFNGSLSLAVGKKSTKVWDCFRFFGGPFVEALKDWEVGTPAQIKRIYAMKKKRGAFDKETPDDVRRYCQEECHLLAVMMRKVITAHEDAGMKLTSYYGAGSTASALLNANKVGDYKGTSIHDLDATYGKGLARAIACAFFGGRFENATIGFIEECTHGFDISSAYPFALSALPCLMCGTWKRVKNLTQKQLQRETDRGNLTVAAYEVKKLSEPARRKLAWGPLPCRDEKGSISYGVNFTGWAWAPELLAALDGWPGLVSLLGEAWIYEVKCKHKPFKFLPEAYRQRVAWGKDGKGKSLKLGVNATYGKTAQAIGDDPPFQSWVWAGMTTATTRGQLLRAISSAKRPWNVLAVATDGIYATEKLKLGPPPWDTGTSDLKKPLGGWEHKEVPEGIFIVKPGLYYRHKADMAEVRARGIGRRELFGARKRIEKGFLKWDRENMAHHVPVKGRRFWGAKHSIMMFSSCSSCKKKWPGPPEAKCPKDRGGCGEIGDDYSITMTKNEHGEEAYGTWGLRTAKIAYDPYPKRERHDLEKTEKRKLRLHVRDLGGIRSRAYDVGSRGDVGPRPTTPEGVKSRETKDFELEQPDWNG